MFFRYIPISFLSFMPHRDGLYRTYDESQVQISPSQFSHSIQCCTAEVVHKSKVF